MRTLPGRFLTRRVENLDQIGQGADAARWRVGRSKANRGRKTGHLPVDGGLERCAIIAHVFLFVLGLAASTARYLSSPFPAGSENPVVVLIALNAPVLLWLMRGLDGFLERNRDRNLFVLAPKPQPPTEVSV